MNRINLTVLLFAFLSFPVFAQESDTLRVFQQADSINIFEPSDSTMMFQDVYIQRADSLEVVQADFSHSASKAIMYALALPGLGQAYNKKFYKIPIVWAALGGVGYAIIYNTKQYQQSLVDYALLRDQTNEFYLKAWRRNVELSYIGLIAVYALQMVDAYVDAQLYSWDVSEDLSLHVAPSLQPLMAPSSQTGQSLGLTFSFKF